MLTIRAFLYLQGTNGIHDEDPRHQVKIGQFVMPICRTCIFGSHVAIECTRVDVKPVSVGESYPRIELKTFMGLGRVYPLNLVGG